jgi:hypothetical protein
MQAPADRVGTPKVIQNDLAVVMSHACKLPERDQPRAGRGLTTWDVSTERCLSEPSIVCRAWLPELSEYGRDTEHLLAFSALSGALRRVCIAAIARSAVSSAPTCLCAQYKTRVT